MSNIDIRNRTRVFFTLAVAAMVNLALTATSTNAAIIAATDFNSTTKSASSQDMTNIAWTGDDLVAVTPSTTISTVASNNAGYFTTGFGATGFAPDQNIENEGPWTANIDIAFNGGATGSLTSVAFDIQALTNTGTPQGSFRAQNFEVKVNGTIFDVITSNSTNTDNMVFTDVAVLNTGTNLIEITADGIVATGWNMGIDNLVFNGSVTAAVPEPSTFALAALGLLGLGWFARRRKR